MPTSHIFSRTRSATRTCFGGALRQGLLAAALLGASLSSIAQPINDVPMAVKNNVAPNFMFMVDSSGSMLHVVQAAPFNSGQTYANCPSPTSGNNNIVVPPAGTPIDLVISSGIPYASMRLSGELQTRNRRHTSVTTSGYRVCFLSNAVYPAQLTTDGNVGQTTGSYTGNFLNWYFGNYDSHPTTGWTSGRKRLSGGGLAKRRWEVAREATAQAINELPVPTGTAAASVRVGLSTYRSGGTNGGLLRSAIQDLTSASRTDILETLDELPNPSGYTPLASTLSDIGRYIGGGYAGNVTLPNETSVSIDNFLRKSGYDTNQNSCLSGTVCGTNLSAESRPVQQWCQRSYAFLLTDGRPTFDRAFNNNAYIRDFDGDCTDATPACGAYDRKTGQTYEVIGGDTVGSDYLDDVAMALHQVDLRPDLQAPDERAKKNNLTTYAIGFADEAVKNDPLLIRTARQGGGKFLAADDEAALTAAMREVITDAFAEDAASSAVAVANPDITNNGVTYAPSYNAGSWYGDLEAFALNPNTAAKVEPRLWSVQERLDAQANLEYLAQENQAGGVRRKIVTLGTSGGVAFLPNFAGAPASLTSDVVNYLRGGKRSLELADGTGFRIRSHILGDIVNAEPVVVNYPVTGDDDIPIIFQAANDGMLHVIDGRITQNGVAAPTGGMELWSYVPKAVHGRLAALTQVDYDHQYFVDATPSTASITGFGALERILVGGLGKGGGAYYALDITSFAAATETAAASKVKWEFPRSAPLVPATQVGYTFGTPLIVNTAAGWRVVVSSGYANGTNGPNGNGDGIGRVWILNPNTGAVEGTISTGVGTGAAPSGLAHLSKLANTSPDAPVQFVYGGDLYGNVWRFDLNTLTATRIAELRDGANVAQPINAPVEVGPVTGSLTKYFVYAGTGQYLADQDVPGTAVSQPRATQRQSMYGIIDDTSVTSPTLPNIRGTSGYSCGINGGTNDLVCQTLTYNAARNSYVASTHSVDATSRRGWYFDFPNDTNLANGRVTGKPVITTGGTLAFTLNMPSNVVCEPGGSSWFFTVAGQTGGGVLRTVGGDLYYDAGTFLGNALASRVIVVITADGKRGLVQLSNKELRTPEIPETQNPSSPPTWRRIYWRQLK